MSLDIVAAYAALNVATRLFGMEPTTRAKPERCEPRHHVRRRLEVALCDIAAGFMALHTKRLRFMTRRTVSLPSPRVNAVREPIVKIVNIL
jgi:hypothetical protein